MVILVREIGSSARRNNSHVLLLLVGVDIVPLWLCSSFRVENRIGVDREVLVLVVVFREMGTPARSIAG